MSIFDLNSELKNTDSEIAALIDEEFKRQSENIELIASENFTSLAVMQAMGSCFTNKYAEGYPAKRYYNGCENCDGIEALNINKYLIFEAFLPADIF